MVTSSRPSPATGSKISNSVDAGLTSCAPTALRAIGPSEPDNSTQYCCGAKSFIFGTVVTSFGALLLATPISIAIALFLTELAPRWIRSVVGPLVELLA